MGGDPAKVDAYENTAADYEELPELDDGFFERATPHLDRVPVRGRPPLGERPKKQITLRLDQDVIEHFRAQGSGWQGAINATLRRSMGG